MQSYKLPDLPATRSDSARVAWLKQSGPGYQTRANQILREKMLADLPR